MHWIWNKYFTILQSNNFLLNSQKHTVYKYSHEQKQQTDRSKWRINQWTWYKIMIISQLKKLMTSCETAKNVPTIKIQIEKKTITT